MRLPGVDPDSCRHASARSTLIANMIQLENVTKIYKGDVVALRDANADIEKGEFVFLVGPSGSGKSTFIRLLNKEETPERRAASSWPARTSASSRSWKVPYLRRNIGCVFQDFKLLPNKTVSRERRLRPRGDRSAHAT